MRQLLHHRRTVRLTAAIMAAPMLAGCGLSSLLVIPTLFATQSRLAGCPDEAVAQGSYVHLTFVIVHDDDSTEAVDDGLTWIVRDGVAELDDSNVNPVTVRLTNPGIVTVRADYEAEEENVNPAICTMIAVQPQTE